jgi:plastocyanin
MLPFRSTVKGSGAHVPWLIRAALGLGMVLLLVAALGGHRGADEPQPAATPVVIEAQAAPTTVALVPRPTSTTQPFVERIISRISRDTPAPYPTSTPPPANTAFVNIVDFGYLPGVTRIRAGQTVVWTNGGRELHDVTGDDDWHSGPIEPPMDFRHTFGFAGTFNYSCTVHRDMHGTVIVSS